MNYPGPPGRAPDQQHAKLRSILPNSRRQRIAPLTQTYSQSQTTPSMNQNQSSILNVNFMKIISNPFSVPQRIQHQQNAGDAAQVHHAPKETFPTNGNVKKVESSTDSIVSSLIRVAGTKSINIQTAPSTQLQGNSIHELKIEKKEDKIPIRSIAISTNSSVVANQNQSEDQQR
ncbi:MAG: hypothetical protein EZS28_023370 [Streblomastix strix]|uniref:Uncharacterized protein n=1 Tax=Streblomastix strix TaxID=222440 RepID=A0A5J4VF27_9EUKA|nr:MAG: hypothetical protein EZS28_023370 [Streblomastix strix]